jgi:hypothetical protein
MIDRSVLQLFTDPENQPTQHGTVTLEYMQREIAAEREACYALRQTLPNPYDHCQVSAHAHNMAIAAYGAAIRARENDND